MKLIILVGPPGSGKSTFAKQIEKENGYVHVSQDDQGKEGHMREFRAALSTNEPIVVDRMNFSAGQRAIYIRAAQERGYHTQIRCFYISRDKCFQRVMAREDHPTIKTEENARSALSTFFKNFERPSEFESDEIIEEFDTSEKRKTALICDLDGTLCNIDHRLHYVRREGKKDWKNFMKEIDKDTPNSWCVSLVNAMLPRVDALLYVSGRSDDHRKVTEKWLLEYSLDMHEKLIMRARDDHRSDEIVKEIIYLFEIKPYYDIIFAVDDRPRVGRMWRKNGVTTLMCNDKEF